MDAPEKAQMLLLVGNREPVFDDLDTRAHQHFFEFRHGTEKLFVFVVVAKTHHPFDPGAVIPTAIETHDFTGRRQVRGITLKIPLGAFAIVRRRQRGNPAYTRIQALGDAFDHAAFARRIAPFKNDHDFMLGIDHPVLQFHQFALQAE